MSYAYFDHTPERAHHSDDIAVLRGYVDTIKARHGVSQRDQAAALGIGWTTMRDWLNGNAKWPKSAQMVLEKWASGPTEDDVDGVANHCPGLPADEERRLIEAAQCAEWILDSVTNWDKAALLQFAVLSDVTDQRRHFSRSSNYGGFCETVVACLCDPETGDPLDFQLSDRALLGLCAHYYERCLPVVLVRLADLLDAD